MSSEQLRRWLICSHVWCKELVNKYGGNYNAQLALCMKELIRQKKNGMHNLF